MPALPPNGSKHPRQKPEIGRAKGNEAFARLLEGVLGGAVNFEFPHSTFSLPRSLPLVAWCSSELVRPLASRSQPQKESNSVDGAASGN